jgi:hypothetical protein
MPLPSPGFLDALTFEWGTHAMSQNLYSVLSTTLIVLTACQRPDPTPQPPAGSFVIDSVMVARNAGSDTLLARARVSEEFFPAVQMAPGLGRSFVNPDFTSPTAVAMLSWELFRNVFGAQPEIIGTSVRIGGQDHIIIGIVPPQFSVPAGVSLWTPQPLR